MDTKTILMTALAATLLPGAVRAGDNAPFAGAAPLTEVSVGTPQDTYGTGSLTVYVIPAANFTGTDASVNYSNGAGIDRFVVSGGGLVAGPMLPNGSQIERIEIRACDSSAAAEVRLTVGPCGAPGGQCGFAGTVATGVAATPGCTDFATVLAAPLVVNNRLIPILTLVTTGTTSATSFSAVKLYYRLQVSPAPGVATFPGDVPTTHPFFRFVEALAAAGITGGCGTGAYCPDAPVTRGQMAVFLATSLGLHFPN